MAIHVLIVYAHHEGSSFNAALRDAAVQALHEGGHEVSVSDLYAMRFDPVSDRRNFRTVYDPERLRQQDEERHASRHDGFAGDIATEIAKLRACDLLIFQFPIWWLGMPAILKGWVDRVFAVGVAYGGGRRFDTGMMRGKSAMCVLTVGGAASDYDGSGSYAPVADVLYPIHRGIFEFTGFEVLRPFVAYAPQRADARTRGEYLHALRDRMVAEARKSDQRKARLGEATVS
jgi:NAD(P)H dehydrogenase (quinone)